MFLEVDKRLLVVAVERKNLLALAFEVLLQDEPLSLAPFFLFFLVPALALDDLCRLLQAFLQSANRADELIGLVCQLLIQCH